MIASAYVADRMAEFSGSYVLGLSSYNAGPGRTRQWIAEFGDPRKAYIDPIDWIERIPIEETRRYVAKVLSNIQIYRARLGEEATALRLDEDLNRAREASLAPPQRKPGHRTDTAESGD
jgi:soluble lytic murein transglycosylase